MNHSNSPLVGNTRVGLGALTRLRSQRSQAGPSASLLGQKGAPWHLRSDQDLVPPCATVQARRRPGRSCFIKCEFKQTSDGQVFSY